MITHTHTWGKYYECSTNHHIKAHHHISRSIQLQNLRLFIRRAFQMLQDTKDSELFDFLSLSSVERSFSSSPTSLRWKYVISLVVLKWRIVQCCSIDHRLDSWWWKHHMRDLLRKIQIGIDYTFFDLPQHPSSHTLFGFIFLFSFN